jgi:hypothetical protein
MRGENASAFSPLPSRLSRLNVHPPERSGDYLVSDATWSIVRSVGLPQPEAGLLPWLAFFDRQRSLLLRFTAIVPSLSVTRMASHS